MDFDGVVGWLEWEGDLAGVLPWLHAATAVSDKLPTSALFVHY